MRAELRIVGLAAVVALVAVAVWSWARGSGADAVAPSATAMPVARSTAPARAVEHPGGADPLDAVAERVTVDASAGPGRSWRRHLGSLEVRLTRSSGAPAAGVNVLLAAAGAIDAEGERPGWMDDAMPLAQNVSFWPTSTLTAIASGLRRGRTDDHGVVVFPRVRAGTYWLETDRAFGRGGIRVAARRENVANVTLPRGIDVHGQVVDDLGRPLAEVGVKLGSCEVATSDRAGRFAVLDLPPGGALTFGLDDYAMTTPPVRAVDASEPALVSMTALFAVLEGRVTNSDGEPVPGATITSYSEAGRSGQGTTNAMGWYSTRVPAGRFSWRVRAYTSAAEHGTMTVPPGRRSRLDVQMTSKWRPKSMNLDVYGPTFRAPDSADPDEVPSYFRPEPRK